VVVVYTAITMLMAASSSKAEALSTGNE
jgi:hypothetical protein